MQSKSSVKVREVEIPPIEIISEQTTDERIIALLQKRELAAFQVSEALKIPGTTASGAMKKMERRGLLSSRRVLAKVNGLNREIRLYRPK